MTRAVTLAEIADTNTFVVDVTNNRVGIASTTPTTTLDVGGAVKATSFTGNVTGNATGLTGTPDISVRNITGVAATFTGVLTYEDVTNIDSIGIITARSGVSIGDSIFHTGDTNTAIRFPAADTFTVETGGSERIRVNSSGLVGVNTDSPGRQLTVSGGSAEGVIQITNNTSGAAAGNGFELLHFTSGETQLLNRENGAMRFDTNGTERLRIDSSGRLLVGTDTSRAVAGVQWNQQVEGTGNVGVSVVSNSTSASTSYLILGKSRGSSIGSNTIVNNGDPLGIIFFNGADGDDLGTAGASVRAEVDGTPGANDMPGRLVFSTTSDGAASPTERLRIDSSGRLLVGTASATTSGSGITPGVQIEGLDYNSGSIQLKANGNNDLGPFFNFIKSRGTSIGSNTIVQNNDPIGEIGFYGTDGTNSRYGAIIRAYVDGTPGANDMPGRLVFSTTADGASSATERLRIDSSGRLLVNTSTPTEAGSINSKVQIVGSDFNAALTIRRNQASDGAPTVLLCKSRGTDNSANVLVNSGDGLGNIRFFGADATGGNDFAEGAAISATVDGTPGSNDMPGRLEFKTTADGASSPTERMRISSNGNVDIGSVSGPSGSVSNTGFRFMEGNGFWWSTTGQNSYWNTSIDTYFNFRRNGSASGSIVIGSSSTSFNTSSDYRLKENVVDLDGAITRVKQLAPKRFNFIVDVDRTVDGFLAHEAQVVVPEAVTGTKDQVDADGNAVIQGIDQAKLVPLLTAALQEAIAKIETLETKVAALEAG